MARTRSSSSAKKRKKKLTSSQQQQHHLTELLSLLTSATSLSYRFLSDNDLLLHPTQTLTLESSIKSIALSLTNLHSLLSIPQTLTPSPLSSPSCWFDRFTASVSDSDPRWIEAFRMSKPHFDLLLQTLIPSLLKSASPVPPNHKLAAALFHLAHAAPFKSVGRRFDIDSAATCRSFYEVCKAVNDRLGHLFEFPSDMRRIIEGFGWISLPNCCGVLGFHKFVVDGEAFGKNGGLIVQGLVDTEGRFLDVSAGWPGSMPADVILRRSKLFARVEESKELLTGPRSELINGDSIRQYFLGDSCCPLLPWLLTPFPRLHEGGKSVQGEFNSVHNRGMEFVDKAFERVRARWQLLSMEWNEESVDFMPFVVITGCLLHNFLIKCSEPFPEEIEKCLMMERQRLPVFNGVGDKIGGRIRSSLATHLRLVNQKRK
eukprot:TRINITY_DN19359_c0_g1_i1.p1 TRINITY_DN19359_c0_g1~~TRINITY_DN19359_c0_g1_i1.p1  ORF type:complete len:468 (+),score=43.45 TRINITY_DN19359_c0_g1_i1:117-1406(+)